MQIYTRWRVISTRRYTRGGASFPHTDIHAVACYFVEWRSPKPCPNSPRHSPKWHVTGSDTPNRRSNPGLMFLITQYYGLMSTNDKPDLNITYSIMSTNGTSTDMPHTYMIYIYICIYIYNSTHEREIHWPGFNIYIKYISLVYINSSWPWSNWPYIHEIG